MFFEVWMDISCNPSLAFSNFFIEKGELIRIADPKSEKVFAIELGNQTFFPLQDFRYNISALRTKDGTLAQWKRYSAYGDKQTYGDLTIENPWGFSNRREILGLVQFAHRYYNPSLMRWLTPDPLGFEDGLNVYNYVRNNPFKYRDPDGRLIIPVVAIAFSATEIAITWASVKTIAVVVLTVATTYLACDIYDKLDNNAKMDENEREAKEEKKKVKGQGKDNAPNSGGPPRDKQGNYLPDPTAVGSHSTIDIKEGRAGPYVQGATYDDSGKFTRRTNVTDHGRRDHVKPHYHNAVSLYGTEKKSYPYYI